MKNVLHLSSVLLLPFSPKGGCRQISQNGSNSQGPVSLMNVHSKSDMKGMISPCYTILGHVTVTKFCSCHGWAFEACGNFCRNLLSFLVRNELGVEWLTVICCAKFQKELLTYGQTGLYAKFLFQSDFGCTSYIAGIILCVYVQPMRDDVTL